MSLPAYPSYKDSGLQWLGPVPGHWRIHRLKTKVFLLTDKATERNYPVALENIESGSGRFLSTGGEYEGDGVAFDAGDILFGKLRPYLAKVYLTERPGQAVGDFHVLRPAKTLVGRFVQFQILSRAFIDVVDGLSFGSKMPRTSWELLGNMPLLIPPVEEQTAIATFLDRETGKIDALIAEQENLLTLLAEKRQTTISNAVTRGLNPNAPMEDSGVSWLGAVPAHWAVTRIKSVITSIEQGWSPECNNEPANGMEWGVLKAGCVNGGVFNAIENKALPETLQPVSALEIRDGDLLMSRASGSPKLVGSAAYITKPPSRLMLSDKIFRLHLKQWVRPRFFAVTLNSTNLRLQIEASISGAEGLANNLPQSSLKNFWFAVPPGQEQEEIVARADAENRKLDALATNVERAINLLKERRSALIAAAVTGKIDVRDAMREEQLA